MHFHLLSPVRCQNGTLNTDKGHPHSEKKYAFRKPHYEEHDKSTVYVGSFALLGKNVKIASMQSRLKLH